MNRQLLRRLAHGSIRLTNWLVDGVVLSVLMLVLCFGAYAVLDNGHVARQAAGEEPQGFRPAAEGPGFDELVSRNPDVLAWLTLYGTGIDYPLVQGKDNEQYLNTNPWESLPSRACSSWTGARRGTSRA